jgi:hypothetical protein
MRGFTTLLCSAALLAGLALAPAVRAQVSVQIGVPTIEIGEPPVCQWGYYEARPYGCAPEGFYGPGYFHNGFFLGVGPWAGWGYAHGWGEYRFHGEGGGRYHGRGGYEAEHGHYAHGYDDRHGGPHGGEMHHGEMHGGQHGGEMHHGEAHGGQHHDAPHHDAPHHDAKHHDEHHQ